jgi:subtilisin family serine protease
MGLSGTVCFSIGGAGIGPLVGCTVEAIVSGSSGSYSARAKSDDKGKLCFSLGGDDHRVESLIAYPRSGHWVSVWQSPAPGQFLSLKLRDPLASNWWREYFPTFKQECLARAKIGVVDFGFIPSGSVEHVVVTDELGIPLNKDTFRLKAEHGRFVCSLLSGSPSTDFQGGVAPGAYTRLVALDANGNLDSVTLAEAIESLVEEGEVDVINVSFGFVPEDGARYDDLDLVVKLACDAGISIVAACGNDSRYPVALPARYPVVIGVCPAGKYDLAPPGSMSKLLELEGSQLVILDGKDELASDWFLSAASSFDECSDFVAPGVAMELEVDGGVCDFYGSSFASPLIAGLLAGLIAEESSNEQSERAERLFRGRELLDAASIAVKPTGKGKSVRFPAAFKISPQS